MRLTENYNTDLQLARQSAAGDHAAFEQLYGKHRRWVYSLCYRLLGNGAEAEELTQDVFLQVYRKVYTFNGDSAFSSWLYRLVVNMVMMYLRRERLRPLAHPLTEDEIRRVERAHYEDAVALRLINRLTLEKALQGLPLGYRTIFVLHDVMGYAHSEISAMLGITTGGSKSQLHKARLRLRQTLSPDGGRN